jgi:hypothetical protein
MNSQFPLSASGANDSDRHGRQGKHRSSAYCCLMAFGVGGAIVLAACGPANNYSPEKSKFLGTNQGLSCFVPVADYVRKNNADCYPPADDLVAAQLRAGACVTVKLPEHNRYPDLKAKFVQLETGCDIEATELACWQTELIEKPQRTKDCSANR